MALVLNRRVGTTIFVDDIPVTVISVDGYKSFKVEVYDKTFAITDRHSTQILDRVTISAGESSNKDVARMCIDAPRSMKILREELYNQKAKNGKRNNTHAHAK